jgi:hypothetical protein
LKEFRFLFFELTTSSTQTKGSRVTHKKKINWGVREGVRECVRDDIRPRAINLASGIKLLSLWGYAMADEIRCFNLAYNIEHNRKVKECVKQNFRKETQNDSKRFHRTFC